jgi:cytochrome oxidase Cu insertion factor (SCO1/SenC/PrrC family)
VKTNRQRPTKGLEQFVIVLLGCLLVILATIPVDAGTEAPPLDSSLEALGFMKLSNDSDAPDFTLQDASGKSIRLVDQRGKVVFLSFWTTW